MCKETKEEKKYRKQKEIWAYSLKVGDMICDCRYKHLKIKNIRGQDSDNAYDINIILEDGAHCSVMNCCDPADHEWSHTE